MLREGCENLVRLAPTSQAYADPKRVFVGIDESVNYQVLVDTLRSVLQKGRIFMFQPLWIENRETQSGESITVLGSQPIGMFHGHDFGKRKKHDVWQDTEVVNFVVAHLYIYRRVVVLSENLRKDPNGLRRLLSRDVGPVLNGTTDHLLSLVTLFRRGGTPIPIYCDKVRDFLEAGSYSVGYREERF